MSVLALRLAGPLQAWGSDSRFARRTTETAPTKSGLLGLIAAAQGLRRWDPLEELLSLRLGVRIDQPGELLRDFQTAQRPERARDGSITWKSLPLSYRFYIADAAYLAVLEGDRRLLQGIDEAVRRPVFPLFLGRRSCPPAGPVALGIHEDDLEHALATISWQAGARHQRRQSRNGVRLETVRDVRPGETGVENLHDVPVSFDPNQRRYAWRAVVRETVTLSDPHSMEASAYTHDPMSTLRG